MRSTIFRHFTRGQRCFSSYCRHPPPPPGNHVNLKKFKYVDKTHLLAKIMSEQEPTFIHAPAMRRIGKSTTVQMLHLMAQGHRDLFAGMAVNAPDSPFQIGQEKFSCIYLDFSTVANEYLTPNKVIKRLNKKFVKEAKKQHKLRIKTKACPGDTLEEWLDSLTQRSNNKVIMLIDEYDSPMTEFLPESPDKAHELCKKMRPFYRKIKSCSDVFQKVFVTGVSKFSATSMFTDANQFWPLLEKSADYCNLYGFTEKEIRDTYGVDAYRAEVRQTAGRNAFKDGCHVQRLLFSSRSG